MNTCRGHRDPDHMQLDLQLPIRSVPITTYDVSSNLSREEVYNIMWWSLSVTCGRSVGFLRFHSLIKLTAMI